MERQELHDLYEKKIKECENVLLPEVPFPKEVIDAIIDCAKEETIEYLKKNWITVELGGFFDV